MYKLAGHFANHREVEPRFLRWQRALMWSLLVLATIALVPIATRDMPVPMWVGMVILALALMLQSPVQEQPPEDSESDESEPEVAEQVAAETPGALPPVFAELTVSASDLLAAPTIRAPSPPTSTGAIRADRLLREITSALDVDRLYGHQRAALAEFDAGRSVLLCTPPGSGRKLFCDALVLYTLLADAERVLYLCPDSERAAQAEARFQARAEATHWKWNILAVNLTDRAGQLDPSKAQPALVFADPEIVHRTLCGHSERWQTFLSGLGAVIIPDIDRYSGPPAAHLTHIFRRLSRVARRARATEGDLAPRHRAAAATVGEPGEQIRFVTTADPGYRNLARFAERVTGRTATTIGPDRDGAPREPIDCRIVSPDFASSDEHPAKLLADAARRTGYVVDLVGYEDTFTAAEMSSPDPRPGGGEHAAKESPDLVIARLSPATYASLPDMTAHVGRGQGDRSSRRTSVLWQPDRAPLAEHLARERPEVDHPDLRRGRELVVAPDSPMVQRQHLVCTLAETEIDLEELIRSFSRKILAGELAAMRERGHLIEKRDRTLDIDAGAVTPVCTLALASAEDVHAAVDLHTTSDAWQLCERSTGQVIAHLEAERARTAAYPNRILVSRGRRFAVLAQRDQDQLAHRRILAESSDPAMLSTPIRTLVIELIERRKSEASNSAESESRPGETDSPAGAAPGDADDRRQGAIRSLGRAPFLLQHREVAITETVSGVRRFDLRGEVLDATLYEQPITCRYETAATILGFPASDALPGEISLNTLHTVAHGFRQALGAFLCWREEDLDIAPLARTDAPAGERSEAEPAGRSQRRWGTPSIAFVDLHPGAAGFAAAIDLDILRHLATWTLALIRGCPDSCKSGCPRCLHITSCRAPASFYQQTDKAGAEKLLTALLP